MNRICIILKILTVWVMSCQTDTAYISSKDIAKQDVLMVLGEHIKLKSEIMETHYLLYDVNFNNRSIPGATDRNYKIYLKVAPDDIDKWLSTVQITSFPRNSDWAKEIISEDTYQRVIANAFIYTFEDNGCTLDYFVNRNTGEILMHYVQR